MEIFVTDEFLRWYEGDDLGEPVRDAAYEIVELLASKGIGLRFPYQSALRGSKHGCRELRKSAGKHEIRIAYRFDPNRDAIVLLAGDKDGDDRFYEWFVPQADEIWEEYERERRKARR